MKKRIIISVLLLIIICTVGIMSYSPLRNKIEQIFFATKVYNLLNSEEYMNLHQVITKDSVNSRTIMWQSFNDIEGFILDNKKIYIYAVTLENLKDDMVYDYRLGFENNRSNWYKLKTAKENNNKFKVLIFPDSQSNDYTEWKSLAMNAWQNNQDSDFFINMGDLVDNGYDLVQWNGWFDGVEPMVNNIPVAPVQGNHETYTTDWQVAMPNVYLEMFKLPTNGNDKYQNQYYSYVINLSIQTGSALHHIHNQYVSDKQWYNKAGADGKYSLRRSHK